MDADMRRIEYPFGKAAVYISSILGLLSVALALLVLADPILMTSYFVFTSFLSIAAFLTKIRYFSAKKSSLKENNHPVKTSGIHRLKIALLLICFVVMLLSPILLLMVLPPEGWFIGLDGFVGGISISEVIFFLYCRRSFTE